METQSHMVKSEDAIPNTRYWGRFLTVSVFHFIICNSIQHLILSMNKFNVELKALWNQVTLLCCHIIRVVHPRNSCHINIETKQNS